MKPHPGNFLQKSKSTFYLLREIERPICGEKRYSFRSTWGSTRHSCSCPHTMKSRNCGKKCSFIAFLGFVFTLHAIVEAKMNIHIHWFLSYIILDRLSTERHKGYMRFWDKSTYFLFMIIPNNLCRRTLIDNLFWWSTKMLNQSDSWQPSWDSGRIHCTACGVWSKNYKMTPRWACLKVISRKMECLCAVWRSTWNILFNRSSLMFPRP